MRNCLPLLLGCILFASCSKDSVETNLTSHESRSVTTVNAAHSSDPGATASASTNSLPGAVTVPILAGQTIPVGTLTISNDDYLLYVTYELTGDYQLSQTHLYAGPASGIPTAGNGNAVPGRFPYKTTHSPAVSSYTYTIPLSNLSSACYVIAAHCAVIATNSAGQVIFSQTGWSQGPQVNPGGNWAMYTNYCTYFNDIGID